MLVNEYEVWRMDYRALQDGLQSFGGWITEHELWRLWIVYNINGFLRK
jgi:hypothetical protein